MTALIDLAAQRFGRLVVIQRAKNLSGRNAAWACKCDCGNETTVLSSSLLRGITKSCGCLRHDTASGFKHGGSRLAEYGVWQQMLRRCDLPTHERYADYGGRGIHVCDRWRVDFAAFLADMGRRPSRRHSLERENNDGNYEPGNVRWALAKDQARNRRTNRTILLDGATVTIAEAAERTGMHYSSVHRRALKGIAIVSRPAGRLA